MGVEEKIQAVLEWADENGWFDAEFIESLQDYFNATGILTTAQENALDRIIERFRIEV